MSIRMWLPLSLRDTFFDTQIRNPPEVLVYHLWWLNFEDSTRPRAIRGELDQKRNLFLFLPFEVQHCILSEGCSEFLTGTRRFDAAASRRNASGGIEPFIMVCPRLYFHSHRFARCRL